MTTKYFEESLKEFNCHDCLLTGGDGVALFIEPNSLKLAKPNLFCQSVILR